MAGIIPRAQENVRMQPNSPVPIGSAGEAGQAFDEKARLFGKVADLAVTVDKYYQVQDAAAEKIKEAEITNKMHDNLLMASADAKRESQADGSDYKDLFDQKVSEGMSSVYGDTSLNPETRARTDAYGRMAYNTVATQVHIDSAKMKEQSNYDRLDVLGDSSANRVRENPNSAMLGAEVKAYGGTLDQIVSTGAMSAENAKKARDAFYDKVSSGYVSGLAEQGRYGQALNALQANQADPNLSTEIPPEQAQQMGFIDSRQAQALKDNGETYKVPVMTKGSKVTLSPDLTEIMNGMDPKKKAQLIDQLKGRALAETAMKLSSLNAQVQGFKQVALNGGQYSDKDVAGIKDQIISNPHLDPQARARMMDTVNTSDAANKQLQLAATTPRSKWGEIAQDFEAKVKLSEEEAAKFDPSLKSVGQDFAVQADRLQTKEHFIKSMQQLAKSQDSDPAQFVLQTSKPVETLFQASKSGLPADTQRYVQASLQQQDYLGISPLNQRVLPDAPAQAAYVKALPNGYEVARHMDQLEQTYGPYFPKVMAEISGQDKDMAKYMSMTYASPQVRANLADMIKNEKAINDAFVKVPSAPSLNTSIKNMTSLKMEDLQKTLIDDSSNSGRLNIVNSLAQAVMLQARKEAIKPDFDPTASVDHAYQSTVDSQYMFASGGNSRALVPRVIGRQPIEEGVVDQFLRTHSDAEGLKELNLGVPKSYKDQDTFAQAVEREGKWITSESLDSIQLKMRNPDTGTFMPVRDKLGKPIEIKYQDINQRPSELMRKSKPQSRFFSFQGLGL